MNRTRPEPRTLVPDTFHPGYTLTLRSILRLGLLQISLGILLSGYASALDNANAEDAEHAPVLREIEPFVAFIPVRNPYDRAVKVKLLDPTCSCATLQMKESFILPHQTANLEIAVDDKNRSGPQRIGVSVFLTDPALDTIEVQALWSVRACVQVDLIGPGMDVGKRPPDHAWQDVYRFTAEVRPDELNRMRKRIRLSCPPEELPAGGLVVGPIDYGGSLWAFTTTKQDDGSVLLIAHARDPGTAKEGEFDEPVVVHTNHPDKPKIDLSFHVLITKEASTTTFQPQR